MADGASDQSRGALRGALHAVRTRIEALRTRARATRAGRVLWRVGVTVAGVAVIGVGIVLLPLPGPGWLIIFAGLGLLATEYEWAHRLLHFARTQVAAWTRWVAARSRGVQLLVGAAGLALLAAVVAGAWWVTLR